ncbi:MAG: phage major tail tube protein [Synergistaceae bacterium]|nr:phage major tail tube protein [Synergistaceae bacterium]
MSYKLLNHRGRLFSRLNFLKPRDVRPKSLNAGTGSDNSNELECTYIKVWIGGKEVIELDKVNYIHRVHGVDYLESVRRDLGKAG